MNREDIIRMARQVWGDDIDKPWHESALVHLEAFAAIVAAAEREKVAAWMIQRGYATGHGDTTEDLLEELDWQSLGRITAERKRVRSSMKRAFRRMAGLIRADEREQCAKVCDEEGLLWGQRYAAAIRAMGQS